MDILKSLSAIYACFYFLSRCLNEFSSIGFVYALWAGLGIVLITLLGIFFFKNVIDIPGIIGISLIILGTLVLNLFSKCLINDLIPRITKPYEPGLPALGDDLENYLVNAGGSITLKLEPGRQVLKLLILRVFSRLN